MKSTIILSTLLIFFCSCQAQKPASSNLIVENQQQLEVLMIGTSHWNNFKQKGGDVAQTKEIDILNPSYQAQLENIVKAIADFNPTKVFVERPPSRQIEIDSLYALYKTSDWGDTQRNEIYQLGFRVANKLNHKSVYCIDNYDYVFPLDSVMSVAEKNNQHEIINNFQLEIKSFESEYNELVESKASLADILKYHNSEHSKKKNVGLYLNIINKVGASENFVGSYLTAEWYKRNFNILSNIQRNIENTDARVMILMGSGHTSLLEDFIRYIPNWELVELKELIE